MAKCEESRRPDRNQKIVDAHGDALDSIGDTLIELQDQAYTEGWNDCDGELEKVHPRAIKLLRKQKPFIVIAEDEPYYLKAYGMIRENEQAKGTWTPEDEACFGEAFKKRSGQKE